MNRVLHWLLFIGLLPLTVSGVDYPRWWTDQGAVAPGASRLDYAAVNQGQVKNFARAAVAEFDLRLPGGAGDALHALVNGWTNPNRTRSSDFVAVNLGQLKNLSVAFYDRLAAARFIGGTYPWKSFDDCNYPMANIGQVKNLFSFGLPTLDDRMPAIVKRNVDTDPITLTYKDTTYTQVNRATFTDVSWDSVAMDLSPAASIVRTSSNPFAIIPDPTDLKKWQCLDSGTAILSITSANKSSAMPVITSTTGGILNQNFIAFAPGSAAENASNAIDSRIAGKSPNDAMNIFSVRDDANGVYIRNTACWAFDLDLTCVSVWHSSPNFPNTQNTVTLISPRHFFFVSHYNWQPGPDIRFVTKDNTVVTRTMIGFQRVWNTDIVIGILNADVPSSIGFAKVLPPDADRELPVPTRRIIDFGVYQFFKYPWPVPMLVTDQFRRARVLDALQLDFDNRFGDYSLFYKYSTDPQRKLFNGVGFIPGDSGAPVFWVINDQLVLVSNVNCTAGWFRDVYATVNAAMTQVSNATGASTNYQLSPVDLSSFPSF